MGSFGDLSPKNTIVDGETGLEVNIENISGKNRMLIDASISVPPSIPLGKDPLPDMFFTILTAGAVDDTIRVQIVATSNDSTSPDRDLPAVDVTYTLVSDDVGDEMQLAQNVVLALEADTNFVDAELEVDIISGERRAVLHISSKEFSLTGEFYERPNTNDVLITATGTTTINQDTTNKKLIARAKETSLGRDPSNPHKLGTQSISGSVRVRAENVSQLFEEFALNGGSRQLVVDGSVTPVVFTILANTDINDNVKIVEVVKLYGDDVNIKTGELNFMGGAFLPSGIDIKITKNGVNRLFRNIKTTNDFLSRMASTPEKSMIVNQSGGDYIVSAFDLVSRNTQLSLEPGTTDKIEVIINDKLTSGGAGIGIDNLFFVAEGFLEDS